MYRNFEEVLAKAKSMEGTKISVQLRQTLRF